MNVKEEVVLFLLIHFMNPRMEGILLSEKSDCEIVRLAQHPNASGSLFYLHTISDSLESSLANYSTASEGAERYGSL
jgi:hypothetical protein